MDDNYTKDNKKTERGHRLETTEQFSDVKETMKSVVETQNSNYRLKFRYNEVTCSSQQ